MSSHSAPNNNDLLQQLADEQWLGAAMRAATAAASPQQLAETLVDFLHTPIAICSIWRCEVRDVTYTNTQRHVELVGIAGQDIVSAAGIGTQILVDDNLHDFNTDAPLSDQSAPPEITASNLLKTLLKTCPVSTWILQPLIKPEGKVGLVFIGTNAPDGIDERDLRLLDDLRPVITMQVALHALQHAQAASYHEHTALLNTVHDGVLITRPTPEGTRVRMVNDRFRGLFNCYTAVEGLSLTDLLMQMQVPPTVRQRLAEAWRPAAIAPDATRSGEFEMVTADGKPVDIVWYSVAVADEAETTTFARLLVFHDVAPERAAVQVRSAFLTRVSHELRTPLTSINGFAELILSEAGDTLPPGAQEYVEIIHNSSQKLKHIFTDLIEMTRAYAGEVDLVMMTVDLPEVVAAAIRSCDPIIAAKNLSTSLEVVHTLPPVMADSERLRRVVSHLVTNAVQFAPVNGHIDVTLWLETEAHNLPAGAPSDAMLPAVVVSIIDDGAGIAPEDAELIFEPFYRRSVPANGTPQTDGVGMGLAMSRSFIDLHRGKIWVQPNHDGASGGRVFFTLPVNMTAI